MALKKHGRREWVGRLIFLRQFFEKPSEVASIAPSSDHLVDSLLKNFNYQNLKVAVEYGPGTGAITYKLMPLIPPSAKFIAAEPNEIFRAHLQDYAQNIAPLVLEKFGQVDLIVSGLPCSIIPLHILERLFDSTHLILRPGGEFRMFIYTHTLLMPKMHRMMRMLKSRFSSIETSAVWINMPPAIVIRCVK
jgi:phospholipid N-methyltransferase